MASNRKSRFRLMDYSVLGCKNTIHQLTFTWLILLKSWIKFLLLTNLQISVIRRLYIFLML
jgi:hypothetical protein